MAMENISGPMVIVMLVITKKENETAMESCITITEIYSQGHGRTGLSKAMALTRLALKPKQVAG